MDQVICVYLSLDERLARLRKRDHTDDGTLLARIHNQMSAEEMMRRADYVVLNYEGNPRSRQVEYIDRELRSKN
jgi:dephospho-CoA kinase